MCLDSVQRLMPARVKFFLKFYYRRLFSDRLQVLFWPTFGCNYACTNGTVCTKFDFTKVFPKTAEKRVEEWFVELENLPPGMIYMTGRKPSLYAGLPERVNDLPQKNINYSELSATFRRRPAYTERTCQ